MNNEVIGGILIPFVGTTLGAAGVFFMKKELSDLVQRALTGFAAGVMVAASVWESSDSGDGSVRRDGTTGIHPGCGGLLDRNFIFTGSGSYHSSSAP